jgi:general secretion pathway protein D
MLGLAACNPPEEKLPRLSVPPHSDVSASPRVNGGLGPGESGGAVSASIGISAPNGPAVPGTGGGGDVSLDFADTDIRAVVAQILGNILHVDYTIDPAVHGTVTLHTASALNRAQLLATLQALLAQNGAALLQAGSLYRVVPEAASTTAAGATVVPLQYTSAEALARTLQPFIGTGRVAADAGRNALVISGDPGVRDSLANLARAFDIDLLAGQSYALLPVAAGDAKDFAGELQEAMRAQNGGALAGRVQVLPMQRIDAVLVVASTPSFIADARRIYQLLDRKRRDSIRNWHVYYLRNSRAESTAYVLQRAFTPNDVTAQPSAAAGQTAPGAGRAQVSGSSQTSSGFGGGGLGGGGLGSGGGLSGGLSGGGLGGGGLSGGLGGGGLGGGLAGGGISGGGLGAAGGAAGTGSGGLAAPAPASSSSANPLLGGLDQGSSNTDTNALRIIPNPDNQAVLVYGTSHEQDLIEAMLRKIDILPLQVRIDATIAEVDLNDQLQYGTQFFFKSGGVNGILNNASGALTSAANTVLGTSFPGFVLAGSGQGGAPIALSALQAITSVHVLSSPEILVQDNQPARLQVGQLVPYLTSSSQSTLTSGSPVINSVNYQPTGVIMQVIPRVNTDGLVTLDIMQEVSSIDTTVTVSTTGISSPTFSERNVTSRVVVQDGQTVGLAGLIQDNASSGNSGIPWLKDVPVLGVLAGTQNNQRTRTELLVLITPHVERDTRDAMALTEDLREQLRNAARLPYEVPKLKPSGSDDPNRTVRQKLHLE